TVLAEMFDKHLDRFQFQSAFGRAAKSLRISGSKKAEKAGISSAMARYCCLRQPICWSLVEGIARFECGVPQRLIFRGPLCKAKVFFCVGGIKISDSSSWVRTI